MDHAEANTRLIADLLEALQAVKALALPGATHIHQVCDAAIAKALEAQKRSVLEAETYRLGDNWIQCRKCSLISYHPKDVEERYCGHCHIFHEDEG